MNFRQPADETNVYYRLTRLQTIPLFKRPYLCLNEFSNAEFIQPLATNLYQYQNMD